MNLEQLKIKPVPKSRQEFVVKINKDNHTEDIPLLIKEVLFVDERKTKNVDRNAFLTKFQRKVKTQLEEDKKPELNQNKDEVVYPPSSYQSVLELEKELEKMNMEDEETKKPFTMKKIEITKVKLAEEEQPKNAPEVMKIKEIIQDEDIDTDKYKEVEADVLPEEPVKEPVKESVNESVNESVKESVKEPVKEPVEEVEEPVKKRRGRPPKTEGLKSTKQPKIKILEEIKDIGGPNQKITIPDIASRLPTIRDPIKIKTSAYYLNNRKYFINKLTNLFAEYKEDLEKNKASITCSDLKSENENFTLLSHQKVARDYLNLHTPYRGLLLYFSLGSGKSCTAIAIAEGMKSDRRIILMTPASLKTNFFAELKKCGDPLYKRNQFWEFISTQGNPDLVPLLAKSLSLSPTIIQEKGGAWLVNIKNAPNFSQLSATEQSQIDVQLDQMIRNKYIDINYNGLNKRIFGELTRDETINPFDNSVVVIDEAHNFVSRIVNKLKTHNDKSISYKLYHLLMNAQNTRIVLLSGTPIINYPNEIAIMFNILRGTIYTWSISVKTTKKISRESLLDLFKKGGMSTVDYVDYLQNTIIITRNPFGFVNTFKGKVLKNTTVKKVNKVEKVEEPKTKKGGKGKTQKRHHEGHIKQLGGDAFTDYTGVALDETGNISNDDFIAQIKDILQKNGIEIKNVELELNKALPDDSKEFLEKFIDISKKGFINPQLERVFEKRILGLSSYFRSSQEGLLPKLVESLDEKTKKASAYHLEMIPMSDFQYKAYAEIRMEEVKKEKSAKLREQKAQNNGDDLFKTASSYRIFSRLVCNYAFPTPPGRPLPSSEFSKEADVLSNDVDEGPREQVEQDDDNTDDIKEEKEKLSYKQQIDKAMTFLKENQENTLSPSGLQQYSPKFARVLSNLLDKDNIGLHLLYSQFRTIEGIGILKLILEANGFAEFRIRRNRENNLWEIDETEEEIGKRKFVLYTGTEDAEKKEIVRNIYNSSWELVPSSLVESLKAKSSNNFLGEIIKILMITSSGAEGINLRNTRFVHIIEPYWNMIRLEQVIGRARRICSHESLPADLRSVKVFLYLSTFSADQVRRIRTGEGDKQLEYSDVSKLDPTQLYTTDQTLFENASIKAEINGQLLKAIKETSIDCELYHKRGDPYTCYSEGVVSTNSFSSHPTLTEDEGDLFNEKKIVESGPAMKLITIEGKEYVYKIADVNKVKMPIYDKTVLQTEGTYKLLGNVFRKEENRVELV